MFVIVKLESLHMQSCVCIYLIYNILIYITAFLFKSTYSLVGDNKLSEFCKQCAIYSFENNMSLIIAT